MRTKQIVVIGASAGGIEALRELVAGLPAEFPLPIGIVFIRPRNRPECSMRS